MYPEKVRWQIICYNKIHFVLVLYELQRQKYRWITGMEPIELINLWKLGDQKVVISLKKNGTIVWSCEEEQNGRIISLEELRKGVR